MPIQSKAQQRAMYSAAEGKSTLGIPKSVGKDFVAAGPKGGSFAKLPKRVKSGVRTRRALGSGRVSQKALDNAMSRR